MSTAELVRLIPLITGVTAFLLVASLWLGGVVLWLQGRASKRKFMEERLGLHDDRQGDRGYRVLHLWHDGQTEATLVPGTQRRISTLQAICDVMGWKIPGSFLVFGFVGMFIATFTISLILMQDWMLATAVALGGTYLAWGYLTGRVTKNNVLFEGQLADALGLASRSLAAGQPLTGAFRVISEEMEDPIRSVFTDVAQNQDLGLSLEQALRLMADQTTSKDMKMFAATIMIQMNSGGNLADTMARLAEVMRDRIRLARKARALTAQTVLSSRILIAVPLFTIATLQLIAPSYLRPLFETDVGRLMLGIAAVMLLAGSWMMKKMAVMKY